MYQKSNFKYLLELFKGLGINIQSYDQFLDKPKTLYIISPKPWYVVKTFYAVLVQPG